MFPRIALIKGPQVPAAAARAVRTTPSSSTCACPWFCVSTNLTRGVAMVHDAGPIEMWIAASMAVPGIAPPVVYKGELLADGAVVNSLPTDIMQNLERGPIIASDVSTEGDIRAPGIEGPDPEGLLNWTGPGEAAEPARHPVPHRDADQRERREASRRQRGRLHPHARARHRHVRVEAHERDHRPRLPGGEGKLAGAKEILLK